MRSKSAISIPYKSNRRLLRDQRRDAYDKQSYQSPGQGRAAKLRERRSSRKLVIGLPTIGNFRFTETEIQNNKTSAGILFPLSAPISPPFLPLICITLLFRSPRVALRKLKDDRSRSKQSTSCDACDLVLRNHRRFSLCHFDDRTVRKAPRIETNGDREKVFSSRGFANQRAYISDQSYLYFRYKNYFFQHRFLLILKDAGGS